MKMRPYTAAELREIDRVTDIALEEAKRAAASVSDEETKKRVLERVYHETADTLLTARGIRKSTWFEVWMADEKEKQDNG